MDFTTKILDRWARVNLNGEGVTVAITGVTDPEGARDAVLRARGDIADLVLEICRLREELDRASNA